MICIKTNIPSEIYEIDDELKAIYHSKDSVCIWVFKTREDRNKFMYETVGMVKEDREEREEALQTAEEGNKRNKGNIQVYDASCKSA